MKVKLQSYNKKHKNIIDRSQQILQSYKSSPNSILSMNSQLIDDSSEAISYHIQKHSSQLSDSLNKSNNSSNSLKETSKSSNSSSKYLKKSSNSSNHISSINNTSELIQALEYANLQLEEKNNDLENNIHTLLNDLKDYQNGIDPNHESLKELQDKIEGFHQSKIQQENLLNDLTKKMNFYETENSELKQLIRDYNDNDVRYHEINEENEHLRNENENLRLEINSSPSMKDFMALQNTIKVLENKIVNLTLNRNETKEIESYHKHMTTKQRIEIDKLNFKLKLRQIEDLSKSYLVECIQALCRELDISDINDIHPCIVKFKAVVKVVPFLEQYILKLCKFLYDKENLYWNNNELNQRSQDHQVSDEDRRIHMDEVIPVLTR